MAALTERDLRLLRAARTLVDDTLTQFQSSATAVLATALRELLTASVRSGALTAASSDAIIRRIAEEFRRDVAPMLDAAPRTP